jgi:hypothetical protein
LVAGSGEAGGGARESVAKEEAGEEVTDRARSAALGVEDIIVEEESGFGAISSSESAICDSDFDDAS